MANLETQVLEENRTDTNDTNLVVSEDAIPGFLAREGGEDSQPVEQTEADVGAQGLVETEETLN